MIRKSLKYMIGCMFACCTLIANADTISTTGPCSPIVVESSEVNLRISCLVVKDEKKEFKAALEAISARDSQEWPGTFFQVHLLDNEDKPVFPGEKKYRTNQFQGCVIEIIWKILGDEPAKRENYTILDLSLLDVDEIKIAKRNNGSRVDIYLRAGYMIHTRIFDVVEPYYDEEGWLRTTKDSGEANWSETFEISWTSQYPAVQAKMFEEAKTLASEFGSLVNVCQ